MAPRCATVGAVSGTRVERASSPPSWPRSTRAIVWRWPAIAICTAGRSRTAARSGSSSGSAAASSATWASARLVDGDRMPGATVLSRRPPELRREPASPERRRRRHRLPQRGQGRRRGSPGLSWMRWCRACSRRCRTPASAPATASPRCCRTMPEAIAAMLGDRPRSARSGRPARRTSANAACSTASARSSPSCSSRCDGYCYDGKAVSTARQARRRSCRDCRRRARRRGAVARATADAAARRVARRGHARRVPRRRSRAKPLTFRRLPFDHPLFILYLVGHDRRAEVHRARRRRHAAAAPQGAPAPMRRPRRRPPLLLHDLRLDDVELARVGARHRRDARCSTTARRSSPSGRVLCDYADAGARRRSSARRRSTSTRAARPGFEPIDAATTCRRCGSITSTGSPLAPESFDYVYRRHQARRAARLDLRRHRHHLVLRRRRSDRAGVARRDPGAAASAWRSTSSTKHGKPLAQGKGELVCTEPFPVDAGRASGTIPTARRYRAAYFERFPGVWRHGDFAEWTAHGGLIIHGRSDATLNPGGVRIGTAEIYARGRAGSPRSSTRSASARTGTSDVRVVLFVRLQRRAHARRGAARPHPPGDPQRTAAPRHVPAKIVQVADMPRTHSGKITELAVRDVVHGRPVKNIEALANPAALDGYRDLAELRA